MEIKNRRSLSILLIVVVALVAVSLGNRQEDSGDLYSKVYKNLSALGEIYENVLSLYVDEVTRITF